MIEQINTQTTTVTKVSTKTKILLGIVIIACIGAMFAIIGGFKTTQDNYAWTYVGQPRFTNAGSTNFQSLAIDNNNVPYVAFIDSTDQPSGVSVMKFNGSFWEDVGGIHGLSTSTANAPSLTISNNNVPYVAYTDFSVPEFVIRLRVKKFNGSFWEDVGAPGNSFGGVSGYTRSIGIDNNNVPYVALHDYNYKVTVIKFNGSSWEIVGIGGFSLGTVNQISLAIDNNNVPYVAYMDFSSNDNGRITVMKFNGSSWEDVGVPKFTSEFAQNYSLAIDNNNVPYVAYADSAYNFKITVMKFNGTAWEVVGTPGFSAVDTSNISLAIDNNNVPYVAYAGNAQGSRAILMKFERSAWRVVGRDAFSCWNVGNLSLAIDNNNVPYVGYPDACPEPNYSNYGRASVMKYSSIFSSSINNSRSK
ncbi:MAG: hypothetical protein PHH83_04425 [Patescibacteria group bacterium]|nr:hypothetical protein [Patescibacteria group bacterium]